MAVLRINNLRVHAIVGVYEWEQERPVCLPVDVELVYDATAATSSDDVTCAVDYDALSNRIRAAVEPVKFQLVETLAQRILDIVMADERIESATVRVRKPNAVQTADMVEIEISADRG
jgi:dihydroneopterin aldolase